MSDNPTPRTDAAKLVWQDINGWDRPVEGVGIDFARQLERELSNMTDQRDAAMQTLEWAKKSHERELDEAKSEVEAEKHLRNRILEEAQETIAEAKAEAEKWERLYDLSTDHLSLMQERDNYGPTEELNDTAIRISRELADARETIGNLETRHAAVMLHTQTIVDEANELREQRDRLGKILNEIMSGYDIVNESASLCSVYVATVIDPAIAAVKGGSHE